MPEPEWQARYVELTDQACHHAAIACELLLARRPDMAGARRHARDRRRLMAQAQTLRSNAAAGVL